MKQLRNYCIEKSEYGLVCLLVNTDYKWLEYSFFESFKEQYLLELRWADDEGDTHIERNYVPIKELNLDPTERYLQLEQQNKDQISFYWIPLRLIKGNEWADKFKSKLKK